MEMREQGSRRLFSYLYLFVWFEFYLLFAMGLFFAIKILVLKKNPFQCGGNIFLEFFKREMSVFEMRF